MWISSIAALIAALAAAGFFVGRATAPPPQASPSLVTTSTPSISPAGTGTTTSGTSGPSATTPKGDGAQLGSYDVDIPFGYGVPLGPDAPTQSQFNGDGMGDIAYIQGNFFPRNGNKMITLSGGATPTYQMCASSTLFVTSVPAKTGTALCLVETGRMVGVTVSAVSANQPVATLHLTVWQHSSG